MTAPNAAKASPMFHRLLSMMKMSLLVCGVFMQVSHPGYSQPLTPEALAPLPASWAPAQLSRSYSFDIDSTNTGQRYRILIGLPHKAASATGYPVLWALDGLASFPFMEVARPRPAAPNESAQWREKIGNEPAGLIVAIGYASGEAIDVNARALDYTPPTTAKTGDAFSSQHGGAAPFLRFLTQELRPLLARHFAMNPQQHTLFGFSYGGLFALHTLSTQPQYFQRYWAASPSLWFGDHQTLRELPQRLEALNFSQHPAQVMLTVGLDEQYPASFASPAVQKRLEARTMVDSAKRFAQILAEAGQADLQVKFQGLPAHDHHDMLMHGARRVIDFAFAPDSAALLR
ncbi:alpha/beta hydrolase [Polaromonas hydrogenivorans]|uniref:Alpha/beta hydrolase-fold protein n=1 Tax=Polaromonas hydrogenivorans TaxID=335476 RepID=A0AAU7LQG9_9BURK